MITYCPLCEHANGFDDGWPPPTFVIDVQQRDIDEGIRQQPDFSPIARAAFRHFAHHVSHFMLHGPEWRSDAGNSIPWMDNSPDALPAETKLYPLVSYPQIQFIFRRRSGVNLNLFGLKGLATATFLLPRGAVEMLRDFDSGIEVSPYKFTAQSLSYALR